MVITRTPFRASLFGGGTDAPEWFMRRGGAVISAAIDKYCYVETRELPRFFPYRYEIVYGKTERTLSAAEIEHPMVRNLLLDRGAEGIRMTYDADLPARSGLGTSSSFAVGAIMALEEMKGGSPSKRELADAAIRLERELCAEAGGWQDQIAASLGGFNHVTFGKDGWKARPVRASAKRLEEIQDRTMMFFTGFTRISSDVQKLNAKTERSIRERALDRTMELTDLALSVLENPNSDLEAIGTLLEMAWDEKKAAGGGVTNTRIDELHLAGIRAGASGGKILGAGGGGFLLFWADPDAKPKVREAMKGLIEVPFRFDFEGAKVLYSSADGDGKTA